MKFIVRRFRKLKELGLRKTILRDVRKLLSLPDPITEIKENVLASVLAKHGNVVAYGPFKGMQLSSDVWWGRYDLTTKILGVYEEHVLHKLSELSSGKDIVFIDIGAADGYYAVGMAFCGYAKTVHAFEIDKKGRERLSENVEKNKCGEQVIIHEMANEDSLANVLTDDCEHVVLIDIEGAEFDLLTPQVLELLKNCNLVVETHPWMVESGSEKKQTIIDNSSKWFNCKVLTRQGYFPNNIEELIDFPDDVRLLAMSEHRAKSMEWLVLTPKKFEFFTRVR